MKIVATLEHGPKNFLDNLRNFCFIPEKKMKIRLEYLNNYPFYGNM